MILSPFAHRQQRLESDCLVYINDPFFAEAPISLNSGPNSILTSSGTT